MSELKNSKMQILISNVVESGISKKKNFGGSF